MNLQKLTINQTFFLENADIFHFELWFCGIVFVIALNHGFSKLCQ